jgi:hypothetical protein
LVCRRPPVRCESSKENRGRLESGQGGGVEEGICLALAKHEKDPKKEVITTFGVKVPQNGAWGCSSGHWSAEMRTHSSVLGLCLRRKRWKTGVGRWFRWRMARWRRLWRGRAQGKEDDVK